MLEWRLNVLYLRVKDSEKFRAPFEYVLLVFFEYFGDDSILQGGAAIKRTVAYCRDAVGDCDGRQGRARIKRPIPDRCDAIRECD